LEERRILEKAEAIRDRVMRNKLGYGDGRSARSRPAERVKPSSQVNKSPSPKRMPSSERSSAAKTTSYKPSYGSTSPRELSSNLAGSKAKESNEDSTTTSYFNASLEQTRVKALQSLKQQKKLMTSRTYTFSDRSHDIDILEVDERDGISGQWLSKRYFKEAEILEMTKEIKILRLGKLFAKVTPPDFDEPPYANWCVVGIICEKSSPQMSNSAKGRSDRYFILKLGDFKYSVDVHIWGSDNVEKYNKLRVGDIIAVLNAGVFIKHGGGMSAGGVGGVETKTFGLNIRHGECILEIGKSKNFGYCKSTVRSTGVRCKNFIDVSKGSFCSYHAEAQINKTAGTRMEFQGSFRMNAYNKNGVKQSMFLGKPDKGRKGMNVEILNDGSAPRTDHVSRQRTHFSSDAKHRAFFNDDHVGDDDLKKRRKQAKLERDKNDLLKEKELIDKLSGKFNEGSKLRNLLPAEAMNGSAMKDKRELLKAAFTPEMLNNIGFDPTSRSNGKGLLSLSRGNNDEVLNELREVTKKKKINLELDDAEKRKRKAIRDQTTKFMNSLKKKKKEEDIPMASFPAEMDVKLSDSSDEDLEIEDKSFSNFKKNVTK
jgi:minichromosome maintenance protein 10